jgi:cytochrome c556
MKSRCIIISICLVVGSSTLSGLAFAHGTEEHGKRVPTDAQMKRLHAMMTVFSVASAEMETAIEKGAATEVKAQANRILPAVPDLKKSKPHKNIKQITVFKSIAGKMGADITKIVTLAEKGNFAEAKVVFKNMEARCTECHTKFRD